MIEGKYQSQPPLPFSPGGEIAGVVAKQVLHWSKDEGGAWQLTRWEPLGLAIDRAPAPLFEEVLKKALPDWIARGKAQRSEHEERTETALAEKRLQVAKAEYAVTD